MLNKFFRKLFIIYNIIVKRIAKLHNFTNRMQFIFKRIIAIDRLFRFEKLTLNIIIIKNFQRHDNYDKIYNSVTDKKI